MLKLILNLTLSKTYFLSSLIFGELGPSSEVYTALSNVSFMLSNFSIFEIRNRVTAALIYDNTEFLNEQLSIGTSGYTTLNKLWTFVYITGAYHGIVNYGTLRGVNYSNENYVASTNTDFNDPYNQWKIIATGDDYFAIQNNGNGKYLAHLNGQIIETTTDFNSTNVVLLDFD